MPDPPGWDNPLSSISFSWKQGVLKRMASGNDMPKRPDIFPPFSKNVGPWRVMQWSFPTVFAFTGKSAGCPVLWAGSFTYLDFSCSRTKFLTSSVSNPELGLCATSRMGLVNSSSESRNRFMKRSLDIFEA